MDLNSILYSLGLTGMFSSRAFLPAFATSLLLKYGDRLPFLKDIDFIKAVGNEPSWLTSDWAVVTLGILSLVELLVEKSPELRELFADATLYVKSILSGLTTFGILSATDVGYVEDVLSQANVFELVPALLTSGVTFFLGIIRNGVVALLGENDADDDLGLQGLASWLEDLWASFGVLILVLYLPVILVLNAIAFGLLFWLQKRHERRLEKSKIACASCQERIYPFATQCRNCGWVQQAPTKLGSLGKLRDEPNPDLLDQKLRLIELRRSPLSGIRFERRGVDVVCPEDGAQPFADPTVLAAYLERVASRLPGTLFASALFSLIPVLGLVIGVVYYRLKLVAPFRRYLRLRQGLVTRWLIRILFLLLIALQWIPVAGAVVVPIMALINYTFYQNSFRSALAKAGLPEMGEKLGSDLK